MTARGPFLVKALEPMAGGRLPNRVVCLASSDTVADAIAVAAAFTRALAAAGWRPRFYVERLGNRATRPPRALEARPWAGDNGWPKRADRPRPARKLIERPARVAADGPIGQPVQDVGFHLVERYATCLECRSRKGRSGLEKASQ